MKRGEGGKVEEDEERRWEEKNKREDKGGNLV